MYEDLHVHYMYEELHVHYMYEDLHVHYMYIVCTLHTPTICEVECLVFGAISMDRYCRYVFKKPLVASSTILNIILLSGRFANLLPPQLQPF
jgi:hypothetical protein